MLLKLTIIFVFLYPYNVKGALSNSCSDWLSYLAPQFSKNCFYNPDVFGTIPEIIERYLGKDSYENYTVTTEDGYILHMFRILQKNPKGVVMLQHPLSSDGVTWMQEGLNRSMAFNLHSMGYEVWIPNNRGVDFSEKHVNLSINDIKYWQFSFHEIAIYDYSVFIEKISEVSNSTDIIFVGHSMSSTSGLIYASMLPDHAKKYLKGMILISTVAYLKNLRGFSNRITAPIVPLLRDIAYSLGIGGLFYRSSISLKLVNLLVYFPLKGPLILGMENMQSGPSSFDPKLATFFLSSVIDATSINAANHYAQIYNNGGHFRMYDYGEKENTKRYKSKIPPNYPLKDISIPIHLVASEDDYEATIKDNDILFDKLPIKSYGKFYTSGLDHIDFFAGKPRYEKALNHILDFIEKISQQ